MVEPIISHLISCNHNNSLSVLLGMCLPFLVFMYRLDHCTLWGVVDATRCHSAATANSACRYCLTYIPGGQGMLMGLIGRAQAQDSVV